VRTNGTDIPNRRDKKIQQELIQAAGLRSVRQAGGRQFAQVEQFLQTEEYPVVLKPVESAGSDGVKLCHNFEEAKEHFEVLMESQMVNGGEVPAVLCQGMSLRDFFGAGSCSLCEVLSLISIAYCLS
jgi:biotin carboxylase